VKINPGEAVTVTAQSGNAGDPPVSVQWRPQAGRTRLTVTLTAPNGDSEQHTFTVNSAAPKGGA
jgi:hypothetical protein